ncbi:MAG: peptidoglycan-associated lipoprotein Pal [Mariprofundales bacterium]
MTRRYAMLGMVMLVVTSMMLGACSTKKEPMADTVKKTEVAPVVAATSTPKDAFARMDTSGEDALSLSEYLTGVNGASEQDFSMIDANGNGFISRTELVDYQARMATAAQIQEPAHSIYFDFDQSNIKSDADTTLSANAAWLSAKGSNAVVEGNCDERGTREYNLALGQRRADAVRSALAANGVNSARIEAVSFGEERSVCQNNAESCWSQNRRADIKAQ